MIGFSYNSRDFILCIKHIFMRKDLLASSNFQRCLRHTHTQKMKNPDPNMTLEFLSDHYHIAPRPSIKQNKTVSIWS